MWDTIATTYGRMYYLYAYKNISSHLKCIDGYCIETRLVYGTNMPPTHFCKNFYKERNSAVVKSVTVKKYERRLSLLSLCLLILPTTKFFCKDDSFKIKLKHIKEISHKLFCCTNIIILFNSLLLVA